MSKLFPPIEHRDRVLLFVVKDGSAKTFVYKEVKLKKSILSKILQKFVINQD